MPASLLVRKKINTQFPGNDLATQKGDIVSVGLLGSFQLGSKQTGPGSNFVVIDVSDSDLAGIAMFGKSATTEDPGGDPDKSEVTSKHRFQLPDAVVDAAVTKGGEDSITFVALLITARDRK